MAFALTKFKAYALPNKAPTIAGGHILVEMDITATSADVDLDIGNNAGTFWSDADATDLGVKALETIQTVSSSYGQLVAVNSQQLMDRVQIGTVAGAGEYSLAIVNNRPNIAFNAADGETDLHLELLYQVGDNKLPVSFPDLG